MGVVYAARDPRLERTVAVKTMSALGGDETARKRFWREARAAASVNHPNICQIYEIGEDNGQLFIAMELLEGEVLSDLLRRGPLSAAQTVPIGLGILAALSALHSRGIVHRDLKPSNVFLTAHGVKLLDFGLARPELEESLNTVTGVTRAGLVLGTPRYMAPEQAAGGLVDARSDLFAAGAILFEMLAGRPAFGGRSAIEILHATRYEHPPALTGSPAVAAVDRVIRRAMTKRPDERPASADAMAEELRAVPGAGVAGSDTAVLAHALTRLVVLPFRVLRPDPETDFLAFSLPDAISTSLCGRGVAGAALERRRGALRRRGPRPQEPGGRRRRGPRRDGHAAPRRGSTPRHGATGGGPERDPADVADGSVVDGRPVRPAGRPRPAHRRGAVAASGGRHAAADARRAARWARLRALPSRQRAGPDLRRSGRRPRSVPAKPRAGLALCAGMGAAGPLPSRHRQVRRRRARQRDTRRRGVPPCPRAQPAPVDRAQVLRKPRGRHRPVRARRRASARRGQPAWQRSGAVCRSRARLPLQRSVRAVLRRARRSAPAGPQRAHRHRSDAADDVATSIG